MDSATVKVLLVDREPERRRERISVLKEHGYKVFPALDIQQARERCKPGVYNLIVVNSEGQPKRALEFCDWIISQDPGQALLLMAGPNVEVPSLNYLVPDTPEQLLERIDSMFEGAKLRVA
jgi:DNA-binding response OmpR family regulator